MTDDRNSQSAVAVIRPRQYEDIPEAAKALVRVHDLDGYPVEGVDQPEAWLTPPKLLRAWVAEVEGSVTGHVAINRPNGEEAVSLWVDHSQEEEAHVAVLSRLFVAPEARGKDAGGELMRTAMTYAQREGLRLVLDVLSKDTAAMRLYEKLGWQQIGSSTHSYGNGRQTEAICYVSPTNW
ncbi:GNAT family N-acetyltransferase [Streptomyces barkulensis]|uniref:GNAT family N-acetyltransferase n=1 Tax=Streptomyces barkulensis TaxID=1257026 RepID=UPI000C6ECF95|nr:GNAT family N-acetyltransferase [Streptomyces barkulensis]